MLLLVLASLVLAGPFAEAINLKEGIRKHTGWMSTIRHKIHQNPELGFKEIETSSFLRWHLESLGIPFRYPIAKTGIVASVGKGKPVIALRADMDALPIQEPRGLWYTSKNPGVMHACGHDGHMAMVMGAARVLKQHERDLNGTVRFIFQPGEEGFAGAKFMMEQGALDGVDAIYALHNWPALPAGVIASKAGTLMAGTAEFQITFHGRGGHAAMPHQNIDPIPAVASLISSLQTIVSRETSPVDSMVISVTQLRGGDAHNVIPDDAFLGGTMRALTMEQYERGKLRIAKMARAVAKAHQCNVTVDWDGRSGYPPTVNHEVAWDFAKGVAKRVFGSESVQEAEPTMGGEDFAFYTQNIPGAMIFVGHGDPATNHALHNPKYRLDDGILPRGSRLLAEIAVEYLNSGGFESPSGMPASETAGQKKDSGASREEL